MEDQLATQLAFLCFYPASCMPSAFPSARETSQLLPHAPLGPRTRDLSLFGFLQRGLAETTSMLKAALPAAPGTSAGSPSGLVGRRWLGQPRTGTEWFV